MARRGRKKKSEGLTITQPDAIAMFLALGYTTVADWANEKMAKSASELLDVIDDDILENGTDEQKEKLKGRPGETLKSVLEAIANGTPIEVVDGESTATAKSEAELEQKEVAAEGETGTDAEESTTEDKSVDMKEVVPPKKKRKPQASSNGKMSQLDAAVKVLGEQGNRPMKCGELVELMGKQGYWKPSTGRTPANTLNAQIIGDMKSDKPRFFRPERALYALVGVPIPETAAEETDGDAAEE